MVVTHRVVAGACLSVLLFGCAEDIGPTPDLLNIQIFAALDSDPFAGVELIKVRVTGDGLGNGLEKETAFTGQPGVVALPTIPYSSSSPRQVTIEGWSGAGGAQCTNANFVTEETCALAGHAWITVPPPGGVAGANRVALSVGRSPWLRIQSTDEPQTVFVQMAQVNSFAPLTAVQLTAGGLVTGTQALAQARVGHTVTHTVNGEAVIAGGGVPSVDDSPWWTRDGLGGFLNSVEIVDGVSQAVSIHSVLDGEGLPQGGLTFPRAWHTATALPTGQIFFAGGWTENNGQREPLAYVEWYEPSGPIAVLQQPLARARAGHTATLVDPHPDRFTILFVGGDEDPDNLGTYELWSPTTGSSGAVPLPQNQERRFHAAVAAPVKDDNGNSMDVVVIYGGENDNGLLASGLFFVVPNEMMMEHPSPLAKGARSHLTGTYVNKQGLIYFIGGHANTTHTIASEAIDVYDTRAANWQQPFLAGTGSFNLNSPRGGHSTSLVDDTTLVVMGGSAGAGATDGMEVIHEVLKASGDTEVQVDNLCFGDSGDPATCALPIPTLPEAREGHKAVVLDSGSILLVGGVQESPTAGLELVTDLDLYFSPQ